MENRGTKYAFWQGDPQVDTWINEFCKEEHRNRSEMCRILLKEAIVARVGSELEAGIELPRAARIKHEGTVG